MNKRINPITVKIGTRISQEENRRLEDLAIMAGFKSTYALLHYLIFVFLRATSGDDCVDRALPVEVVKLFLNSYNGDKEWMLRMIEKVKQQEQWKARQRKHRAKKDAEPIKDEPAWRKGLFDEEEPVTIESEIRDMFNECQEEGYRNQWSADMNKRIDK